MKKQIAFSPTLAAVERDFLNLELDDGHPCSPFGLQKWDAWVTLHSEQAKFPTKFPQAPTFAQRLDRSATVMEYAQLARAYMQESNVAAVRQLKSPLVYLQYLGKLYARLVDRAQDLVPHDSDQAELCQALTKLTYP